MLRLKKVVLNTLLVLTSLAVFNVSASEAVECKSTIKNAFYTGEYKGAENNLSVADFTRDYFCADKFLKSKYPKGFVSILGSSRISEKNTQGTPEINQANDKVYKQVYDFAKKWTESHGAKYPIMTGAGPGIMEAGSRGATDGGGPSIGYTTYYGPSRKKQGGDASKAFWQYKNKKGMRKAITSDGLIFTSVSAREGIMLMHSAAMIFAPGGTGTQWEIFQAIEEIKSGQLNPVPIYIVGDKKIHWQSFYNRLDDMIARGTFKRHEVEAWIVHVDDPRDVFKVLTKSLGL